MFDVTSRSSLRYGVNESYYWITKYIGEDIPIVLIGNKFDDVYHRKVDEEFVKRYTKWCKMQYFKASCKPHHQPSEATFYHWLTRQLFGLKEYEDLIFYSCGVDTQPPLATEAPEPVVTNEHYRWGLEIGVPAIPDPPAGDL